MACAWLMLGLIGCSSPLPIMRAHWCTAQEGGGIKAPEPRRGTGAPVRGGGAPGLRGHVVATWPGVRVRRTGLPGDETVLHQVVQAAEVVTRAEVAPLPAVHEVGMRLIPGHHRAVRVLETEGGGHRRPGQAGLARAR